MKVGTLLLVLHDVIEGLVGEGLLTAEGDFVGPTVNQDFQLATMVENALKHHGVTLPEDVDKVIQVLPLVLSLAGVK